MNRPLSFLFPLTVFAVVASPGWNTHGSQMLGADTDARSTPTFINWTIVDSMVNAYGPAMAGLKPLAFDQVSGSLAVIHRADLSYGQSSGELWWNFSSDAGSTWTRIGVLTGYSTNARYPTCAIYNPSHGQNLTDVDLFFAAAALAGGPEWGCVVHGFSSWSPFYLTECRYFSPRVSIWTGNDSSATFWASVISIGDSIYLQCSRFQGVPPGWVFPARLIGGNYRNGVSHLAAFGLFPGDTLGNIGHSKSTDKGLTWSAWFHPQDHWNWWNFGGDHSFDFVADAVNHAHFFGVVEDTASHERSVIEVHETSTGWQSRVITSDLKESTNLKYGNIDPMGNALSASISPDGTFFSLVWLDAAVQGDTLPDIWLAYRHISGDWSVPVNLTETPTMAELLLHAAPTLKVNGNGSHTMFLGRTYQAGTTAYPPDESMRSIFFAGSYVITPAWIGHGQAEPGAFRLDQNYPNPFNSATVMSYELRVKSRVRLVVYDLLGREVATLVNEVKAPGTYTATWDGGRFASGMYFCRLAAGGYVQTRKMVLQR